MKQATKKRKKMAFLYWGLIFVLVIIAFLYWFFILRYIVYTDDAYVEGNQVFITPLRSGFVTAIHTDDTFLVKKGQLLIELDKTDALIALDVSKEELAQAVREVSNLFHQVFSYKAQIDVKRADLIRAAQDYKHREDVIDVEGVSREDFEHAIAEFRNAYYSLKWTETLYEGALSLVQGTAIRTHPLVLAKADALREAWVQLYRCSIYSPVEGLGAQRRIQVGMWVDAGTLLMSVIPLEQMWVNANYKETQLKKMRIGQSVKITSDLYGTDVVYKGKIVGLPGAAGDAFSLLPPQNLTGNWIKIVQRLPVRVELDPEELRKHPLRIGLSMEATTDLHHQQGLLVPTSNEGAPLYETFIYEKEERGDEQEIEKILSENLDPSLSYYNVNPVYFEPPAAIWIDVNLEDLERKLLACIDGAPLKTHKEAKNENNSLFSIFHSFYAPIHRHF